MAGMEFEYDEEGGTFYFFLMSFMALVLIPTTYYLWGSGEVKDTGNDKANKCLCDACNHKRLKLKSGEPSERLKQRIIYCSLIIGWILFACVCYKASQVQLDFTEFDPFSELGIDKGASSKEIKKAYRKLSVVYHPDKDTGDSHKFMKLTKAYKALTDEASRKNWEEYGNPDGPGAMQFGIALPKWIVEKQNSIWVLGLYALVFMIALPCAVGTWWYRSIKYSAEKILMDTTQLYFIFFHKTPNMIVKRIIMVLGASFEFNRAYNQEIIERPTDNIQIPRLMKSLPYLNEKNKERPLNYIYSIKARSLVHAHLTRLELPPSTLDQDKDYILEKSLFLVNEMVNIISQLVSMAHAGRVNNQPRLVTVENVIKVGQMLIQARWEGRSSLLQLPHISEDILRHFTTKKRNIRSIQQLVQLPGEERRALMRALTDQEYNNVMNVCSNLPIVDMEVDHGVNDEEDKSITAGSLVTVTVFLTRTPMSTIINTTEVSVTDKTTENNKENEDQYSANTNLDELVPAAPKTKVWEKQSKKKPKTKASKNKKKPAPKKVVATAIVTPAGDAKTNDGTESESDAISDVNDTTCTDTDTLGDVDATASGAGTMVVKRNKNKTTSKQQDIEEDEEDWVKFQAESNKQNSLDQKSKETHIVHCPYFPMVKYEYWWLYVADKKNQELISAPILLTSLRDNEEIQLKFTAPIKTGKFVYTVNLRSDSYFDFDQTHNIKFEVSEHKQVEDHPQWQISEDEDSGADSNSDLDESQVSSDSESEYSDSD